MMEKSSASTRTAYLLLVDGIGTDVSTGYKLNNLYSVLGKMPAENVTVFMDACFSGSKREEGMLASARGVAFKTNVSQQSILLNGKSQPHCVTPSASLDASWREWTLK